MADEETKGVLTPPPPSVLVATATDDDDPVSHVLAALLAPGEWLAGFIAGGAR